jgi:enoyl-CoA hydratase
MTTDSELLPIERDGFVAIVTLPPTMAPSFFGACARTFGHLGEDQDLRAIIVRGGDKCFSYGLDLQRAFAEWAPTLNGGGLARARTDVYRVVKRWQEAFNAIAACPMPVIAAVHGWCIGGGVDLISACDIRLAAADARFSVRETKVAIVADLGSLQRLPRILSPGAVRELAFTGKDIDAARALRIGLVEDVLPDRAALQDAARSLAAEIAAAPPLVVRGVKHVLDQSDGKSVADGLDYVAAWNAAFLASEDLGEAVAAMAERRRPEFKGR